MENKYLQVRKENIFTKFINFFRKVFYKEQAKVEELDINIQNVKKEFINEIKLQHEEDSNILRLQEKYENREIELSSLSDEEIHELNLLYKRQIEYLKREIEQKKTELNFENYQLKNILINKKAP